MHRQIGQRHVYFPIISLLTTLLFTLLFISLGIWQWQRATQKIQYSKKLSQHLNQSPQTPTHLNQNKIYTPLRLSGHFINSHSILLDNQNHLHQNGYHLITPFETPNSIIWVDRGWLHKNQVHSLKPNKSPLQQQITGHVAPPLSKRLWPPQPNHIGRLPVVNALPQSASLFWLSIDDPDPLPRVWSFPLPSPWRHFFYLFQFIVFAIATVLGYIAYRYGQSK